MLSKEARCAFAAFPYLQRLSYSSPRNPKRGRLIFVYGCSRMEATEDDFHVFFFMMEVPAAYAPLFCSMALRSWIFTPPWSTQGGVTFWQPGSRGRQFAQILTIACLLLFTLQKKFATRWRNRSRKIEIWQPSRLNDVSLLGFVCSLTEEGEDQKEPSWQYAAF